MIIDGVCDLNYDHKESYHDHVIREVELSLFSGVVVVIMTTVKAGVGYNSAKIVTLIGLC